MKPLQFAVVFLLIFLIISAHINFPNDFHEHIK